jgi:hypothetical protein
MIMSLNKSQRDVNKQFDQKQFNALFEDNEKKLEKESKIAPDMKRVDESITTILPHMRTFEDIVIIIREMFFKILELLMDSKNPIPYILSSPDRFFAASLFLIVIGSCLLLFSNLMISN